MTFDRVAYWKKRIKEKLLSKFKQLHFDMEELEGESKHINLKQKGIKKAIDNLIKAFQALDKAFQDAKVVKEKKK